jgi:hypothetical protein
MKPQDVLDFFGSYHYFGKRTGMSPSSLWNWINKTKYVPLNSQVKLEKLTNGKLKAEFEHRENEIKDSK